MMATPQPITDPTLTLEKAVLVAGRIAMCRSLGNFFSQTQSPWSRDGSSELSFLKSHDAKSPRTSISTGPLPQNTSSV